MFQLAECAYQATDDAAARQLLVEILPRAELAGYVLLAARAHWLLGTIELVEGRPSESLSHHRTALAAFERSGETTSATALHTLLANDLSALGDYEGAWRHHYKALVGVAAVQDAMRQRATRGEAARAMLDSGEPEAALYIQNDLVDRMVATAAPSHITAALRERALIEDALHRTADALRDVEAARAAERGRARVLADFLAGLPRERRSAPLRQREPAGEPSMPGWLHRVPPGVAMVEYQADDRSLWIWLLSLDRLLLREVPVGADRLRGVCSRFAELGTCQ